MKTVLLLGEFSLNEEILTQIELDKICIIQIMNS